MFILPQVCAVYVAFPSSQGSRIVRASTGLNLDLGSAVHFAPHKKNTFSAS